MNNVTENPMAMCSSVTLDAVLVFNLINCLVRKERGCFEMLPDSTVRQVRDS